MHVASFRTELRAGHKGLAAAVPFDPAQRWSIAPRALWPGRRGFPVRATLNGHAFDSAIVSRSRRCWLLVPHGMCAAAQVAIGDACAFTVSYDAASAPVVGRPRASPRS